MSLVFLIRKAPTTRCAVGALGSGLLRAGALKRLFNSEAELCHGGVGVGFQDIQCIFLSLTVLEVTNTALEMPNVPEDEFRDLGHCSLCAFVER